LGRSPFLSDVFSPEVENAYRMPPRSGGIRVSFFIRKGCCMKRCAAALWEVFPLRMPDRWEGEMIRGDACAEGELQWVQKSEVQKLPIWEGDKLFFRLLEEEHPYFSLKLVYDGDTLKQAVLDGKRIV